MNNSSLPEAADTAASDASLTSSITPTPGDQETPVTPATDLQIVPDDPAAVPTLVDAKPLMNLQPPALPQSVGLQQRQRLALQALVMGKTVEEAAHIANVNPCTIYRWRKYDARFIAAFNAWQAQSQLSARTRLLAANEFAARTILRAAQKGDVRASLAVLKGLGTLSPQPLGAEYAPAAARAVSKEKDKTRISAAQLTPDERFDLKMRRKHEEEEAAAREAANRKVYFDRYAKIPPLPRPITALAIEQSVKANHAIAITHPTFCSFKITAITGEPKPLASAIAEEEKTTTEAVEARLQSLPIWLNLLVPWEKSEAFATKLESLGATVELRPGWQK